MLEINDYIMYGRTGVCEVSDIIKIKDRDMVENEYYVLNPVYDNRTVIKIPVNTTNNRVIMRPVLSVSELKLLMETVNDKKIMWVDNKKQRSSDFNLIINSGDCGELLRLVKTILSKKAEKKALDKKLNQSDMNTLKLAEKLVNEEISVILDISQDEVESYIKNNTN